MEIHESLHHDWVATVDPSKLEQSLTTLLEAKQKEIQALRDRILQFEQKSRAEDAFYQSLSPLRKFFTSRAPSHHKAVEYMVNVKDRMKKIEALKIQSVEIHRLLEQFSHKVPEQLDISHSILEDLLPLIMIGDSLK